MMECGEGDFGWALWKSCGLSYRSSVLSSWQVVCGSLPGRMLTGRGRISFVVRTGYKCGLFGTLDKESITKVFCAFYSHIKNEKKKIPSPHAKCWEEKMHVMFCVHKHGND